MKSEKNIPVRKIILLASIVVLAVIYICQLCFTGRSKIKTLTVAEDVDYILINDLEVSKENGKWLAGSSKYLCDDSKVQSLVNAVKDVKLLGQASSMGEKSRYGLDEESMISVKAMSKGKTVRELSVGKNTSTNGQSYICVDGKNTIWLAQDALNSVFSVTADSLRDKKVYSVDSASVMQVEVKAGNENFVLVKNIPQMGEAAPEHLWSVAASNEGVENVFVNDDKVNEWIGKLSSVTCSSWMADDFAVPQNADYSVTLNAAGKKYSVNFYDSISDENEKIVNCSESKYVFKLQNYNAGKMEKKLVDLK